MRRLKNNNMKSIRGAAFAFFIAALFLFAAIPSSGEPDNPLIRESEEWFILYKGDTPIGYSFNRTSKIDAGLFRLTSELVLNLSLGQTDIRTVTRSTETFTGDLRLTDFETTWEIGDSRTTTEGTVKDGKLVWTDSKGKSKTVDFPVGCVSASMMPIYIMASKIDENKPMPACVLNTQLSGVKVEKISVTVDPFETVAGIPRPVRKLSARLDGIPIVLRVAADGSTFQATQSTLGFVQTKAERDDIVRLGGLASWDPFAADIRTSDKKIADPDTLKILQVRVGWRGADPNKMSLASDMQSTVKLRSSGAAHIATLRIKSGSNVPPMKKEPDLKDLQPYLACRGAVDCDNAEVKRIADSMAQGTKDSWESARDTAEWLRRNIAPDPAGWKNPVDAGRTLRSRSGTARQIAVLFAALARAQGIPVKICYGKTYAFGIFASHYWNEIYNGGWRTIDVTYGSGAPPPVSIKLAESAAVEPLGTLAAELEKTLAIEIDSYK